MEEAGAHALELNVYYLSTRLQDSPLRLERRIETLMRSLKRLVHIPLAVKLAPFYAALANLAARLVVDKRRASPQASVAGNSF
jgi:dihydroorotate dehydrogenase (fumarate)